MEKAKSSAKRKCRYRDRPKNDNLVVLGTDLKIEKMSIYIIYNLQKGVNSEERTNYLYNNYCPNYNWKYNYTKLY